MKKKLILASSDILLEKKIMNICIAEDIYSLQETTLQKYNIATISSHWKKKSKKKKDYLYLKKLYYSVIENLTVSLNDYHNLTLSQKNWHLILGPWLNYAIPIIWDRWETAQKIKKKFGFIKNINIAENAENYLKSLDFNDFIEKSQCESWNSEIFKSIIDYDQNWKPKYKKKKLKKKKYSKSRSKTLIKISDRILKICENFLFKKNLLLISPNFEKKFYFENFYKNKLILRPYSEFETDFEKFNKTRLEKNFFFNLKKINNSKFETYLVKILTNIMPMSYLENFKHYVKQAKKINIEAENIFSVFRHYENDLFKIWISVNNKKLISCTHGGNIEKEFFFNSWQKYSHKYITWNKDKLEKNQINLPINFLLYRSRSKEKIYSRKKELIFLLPHAETKPLRLVDGLFCSEILDAIKKWTNLYKNLDPVIQKNFLWRFGPFKDQWNVIDKLRNNLGTIRVSKKKKFIDEVDQAKVSIHVDLQTTFLETMFMNVPSYVLYNNKFWNVSNKAKLIIKKLEDTKILFYNHKELGKHLNQNYLKIENWWESKKVQNARLSFLDYSGVKNQNFARHDWIKYFKNLK